MANYIKLDWSNSCDLGGIPYSHGFRNLLILDADIGAPEYSNEVQATENGDGALIETSRKIVKNYKFEIVAPEYIADSLVHMSACDDVKLYFTNGTYSSSIRNIVVNVEWDKSNNECLAVIEVKFQQDDQLVKGSCCENM